MQVYFIFGELEWNAGDAGDSDSGSEEDDELEGYTINVRASEMLAWITLNLKPEFQPWTTIIEALSN
jgi:hypothetical protein